MTKIFQIDLRRDFFFFGQVLNLFIFRENKSSLGRKMGLKILETPILYIFMKPYQKPKQHKNIVIKHVLSFFFSLLSPLPLFSQEQNKKQLRESFYLLALNVSMDELRVEMMGSYLARIALETSSSKTP